MASVVATLELTEHTNFKRVLREGPFCVHINLKNMNIGEALVRGNWKAGLELLQLLQCNLALRNLAY